MYYISQSRKDDCGFTCIKMLLASLNKDKNYLYLKETKEEGAYSFKELVNIAKENGVELTGYRIDDVSSVDELTNNNEFLLTIKREKSKHLVVVKKKSFNFYLIKDPALGCYLVSKRKLNKMIEGTLLVVNKVEKKKSNVYFPLLLKKRQRISLILLRTLCLAFVIASTFFVDDKYSPFIPLILLILGLIMELTYRVVCLSLFKKLDDIINDAVVVKNNKYYEYYTYLQKFKSLHILNITLLFFSFALCLFIAYLLIGNDSLNILLVLFTVFYVFFEQVLFKNKINYLNNRLEISESKLKYSSDMNDYKEKIKVINKHSKNIGVLKTVLDITYFLVLIILLALIMILRQKIEITYLLFYFFMFYFFKRCVNDYFLSKERKEKEKIYKNKLINLTSYNNDFECK